MDATILVCAAVCDESIPSRCTVSNAFTADSFIDASAETGVITPALATTSDGLLSTSSKHRSSGSRNAGVPGRGAPRTRGGGVSKCAVFADDAVFEDGVRGAMRLLPVASIAAVSAAPIDAVCDSTPFVVDVKVGMSVDGDGMVSAVACAANKSDWSARTASRRRSLSVCAATSSRCVSAWAKRSLVSASSRSVEQ
jgi:hypothetical protein